MNQVERRVRAHVINGLLETGAAPSIAEVSASLEISRRTSPLVSTHSRSAPTRLAARFRRDLDGLTRSRAS